MVPLKRLNDDNEGCVNNDINNDDDNNGDDNEHAKKNCSDFKIKKKFFFTLTPRICLVFD